MPLGIVNPSMTTEPLLPLLPTSWRVGNVPYLNVQPLIWAFQKGIVPPTDSAGIPLVFEDVRPRLLAARLHAGDFDVAIVPVFEYFQHPIYALLPAGAIATPKHVGSVLLFANEPIEKLQGVYLDTASLTSINLLRVLAAENGWHFVMTEPSATRPYSSEAGNTSDNSATERFAPLPPCWGRLLIGDPALLAVGRYRYTYDLGALWFDLTGLPFVFAAWLVHPRAARAKFLTPFREARTAGIAHLDAIAAEWAPRLGLARDVVLRYLRENLSYEFGEAELKGLREFARLCELHGLCARVPDFRFHER